MDQKASAGSQGPAARLDSIEKIELWRGDITTLRVDAIVNAANSELLPGGGVCGAIHRKAGAELEQYCRKLGGCAVGQAKITQGFALPAKYVVHTVGPVWQGGAAGEAELLAACYTQSLLLAAQAGARSIAFPCISTGIHRYPLASATQIAVQTVHGFIAQPEYAGQFSDIAFCCSSEEQMAAYKAVLN